MKQKVTEITSKSISSNKQRLPDTLLFVSWRETSLFFYFFFLGAQAAKDTTDPPEIMFPQTMSPAGSDDPSTFHLNM